MHIDKDKDCPEMIPFECTHGRKGDKRRRCKCCGVEKRLGRVLKLLSEDENVGSNVVTVMVWEKARRQGKGKNGKDNTQQELTSKPMTVAQLIAHFKGLLGICIPHIQEIRWIKHLQDTDFSKMSLDTILIFSDFAALMVMALRALQTKNSSVDAHAVLANFVVLSVKRVVTVVGKKKNELGEEEDVEEEVTISNVDVIHFFAETFEKGKKNDHCMHNTCLDEIIRKYRVKLKQKYGIDLKYVIIWTDNAPHQYRCRQTFIQIASIRLRHPGIQITHRLAVVDNFKGIHDVVGKDPNRTVRELETVGIRSPTAFMVFVNCIQHLEKFETKWDVMEKARDRRLILKGMFGYNSREMYFVVETKKDFDRLVDQYPGRILLCDRSIIQDTLQHKCIEGTMQLHEVRSIETGIPEPYEAVLVPEDGTNEEVRGQVRPWPVVISNSNLSCNCKVCIGLPTLEAECEGRTLKVKVTQDTDVANQRCKYHLFRKTREYTMLGPVHLEPTSPSSEASVDVANELSELESRELVVASNSNLSNTEVTPQVPNRSSSDDSADVAAIETRLHSDVTSIEALRMLRAEERAMVKGLLQSEPNSAYDLHYILNAAAVVQHTSLRTLREPHWLNDEVINGFRAHYLLPKLDEHSYIFPSQFMSHLLNTGPHGMDPPNYTYENVNSWSGRIRGGLFHCHKLYVPINHENVHWLLMRINMLEKKISLWDPEGEKETNILYADAALNYLKDEYRNTHPSITRTNLRDWLSTWTIEDLSDDCPHQQNGYDCGIFLLLNLCLLIEEDHLSEDSYSQTSINTKEVRNTIAHLLWKASSNRPTPQPSAL